MNAYDLSPEALELLRRHTHGYLIFQPEERPLVEELVQHGLAQWGDYTGEDTNCFYITNRARELL